jgi:hypothetical protein
MTVDPDRAAKADLDRRLTSTSWALFLIMVGGLLLVPSSSLPPGSWLIGVGVIMLGLNVVRNLNGIRMSSVTTILGIVALIAGLGDFAGVDLPVFPILIILVGAAIILRNVDRRSV